MKRAIEIVLPLPPSLNASTRSGITKSGRPFRYKTNEAQKWQIDAIRLIGKQKPFPGRVGVKIELMLKRDRDIDSSFKLLFDVLQATGIVSNDNKIMLLLAKKVKSENPSVYVMVYDLEPYDELDTRTN